MDHRSIWKLGAIVLAVTVLLVATGWPISSPATFGLGTDPAPTGTPKDPSPTPTSKDPTPTPTPGPTPTPTLQGCTPGYWKNNTQAWGPTGYSPSTTLGSVAGIVIPAGFSSFGGVTFAQALAFGGGAGVDGAARTMFREAVAAWLNAAHPGVSYAYTTAQITNAVNAALASNSRATILTLATNLNTANNQVCPLTAAFSR